MDATTFYLYGDFKIFPPMILCHFGTRTAEEACLEYPADFSFHIADRILLVGFERQQLCHQSLQLTLTALHKYLKHQEISILMGAQPRQS